jgi:cardiolipin synthase
VENPKSDRHRAPRLRSGLRRHGLVARPEPVGQLVPRVGLRFRDGNRVTLLETGRAALVDMLEAIGRARSFVHLETYILRGDATGRRFLDALTARASAGVSVRLLYDAFGSFGLDPACLAPLRDAGGEVVAFNPLRRLYPRWAPRRRDHRKILIVDGEVAFTGGVNIGDEYDAEVPPEGAREAGWRDTQVRIEGPAARDLGAVFLESWFRADGPELPWTEVLDRRPGRRGDVRCAVVPDGPGYRRGALRRLLVELLDSAQERARITTPYFAPGGFVLDALERTAARGVEVELILAGRTDHPVLRRAAHSILPRLLVRGVRVYEYERAILHAKSAAFDGHFALVGTSNLDRQSFEHSYEVNLALESREVVARLDQQFERDRAGSQAVDLEGLAARGPWARLLDRLAAVLLRVI